MATSSYYPSYTYSYPSNVPVTYTKYPYLGSYPSETNNTANQQPVQQPTQAVNISANTPIYKLSPYVNRSSSTTSSSPPSIASHNMPSAEQLYNNFANLVGPVPQFANEFAQQGPAYISGLPEEYFQQQRDILKKDLEEQFFGPLGVYQQTASQESAAGRLGSGVGKRIIEETAAKPFAQATVDLDMKTQQQYLQERARVEQFNAQQYTQYQQTLSQLRSDDRSAVLAAQDLAGRLAQAEAGILSQQSIAQLESDLRVWEASLQDYRKEQELLLEEQRLAIEFVRSPIRKDTSESQQQFGDVLAGRFSQGILY